MWGTILLVLLLCGGIWGKNDDICKGSWRDVCKPMDSPPEFPATAEEMEELCPFVLQHLICLQTYINKCGDLMLFDDNIDDVIPYIRDVCKKDSELYQDVVKHLQCFKKNWDALDERCDNFTSDAMIAYEEHQKDKYPDYDDSIYSLEYYCFIVTHEIACSVGKVDRECGAAAKEVFMDALLRTKYLENRCPSEKHQDLLDLTQVVKLEIEVQDVMKEVISLNGKV